MTQAGDLLGRQGDTSDDDDDNAGSSMKSEAEAEADRRMRKQIFGWAGVLSMSATVGVAAVGFLDAVYHPDVWKAWGHFMLKYWQVWVSGLLLTLIYATIWAFNTDSFMRLRRCICKI